MDLNPDAFNRLIGQVGQQFSWRKAFSCPCVTAATNAPSLSCPFCFGKGYQWIDAVEGIAAVPSKKVQREFSNFGEWESGDMMLTIGSDSPLYDMGERDRVVRLNGNDPFSMSLRYGVNDKLPWTVKCIDRVFSIVGTSIVEASIPTQQPDGTLVFSGGAPAAGASYSVSGKKLSEYFVYKDFPSDRDHFFGAKLPIKVQLRRFDLFGR